ncbi:MAG TPA: hypothetical protein VMV44_01260 [Rectinemataceae bacterium]|nr:hypothetical protein [Rectinemataceae bacterium]
MVGMKTLASGLAGLALVLILVAACTDSPLLDRVEALGSKDAHVPAPGASGAIVASGPTSSSFNLTWTSAADAMDQSSLVYKIVASTSNNIGSVADAETLGSGRFVVQDWASMPSGFAVVNGIQTGTLYYVTLLVKDSVDNKAIYQVAEGPAVFSMSWKSGTNSTWSIGSIPPLLNWTYVVNPYSEATMTIANSGFGTLHMTGSPHVLIGGANPSNFAIPTQPPDFLAPGTTYDLIVRAIYVSMAYNKYAQAVIANDGGDFVFNLQSYAC